MSRRLHLHRIPQILFVIFLFWIAVIGIPPTIEDLRAGDQSLNTGGTITDEQGNITGFWDGHEGETGVIWYLGTALLGPVIHTPIIIVFLASTTALYLLFFGIVSTKEAAA